MGGLRTDALFRSWDTKLMLHTGGQGGPTKTTILNYCSQFSGHPLSAILSCTVTAPLWFDQQATHFPRSSLSPWYTQEDLTGPFRLGKVVGIELLSQEVLWSLELQISPSRARLEQSLACFPGLIAVLMSLAVRSMPHEALSSCFLSRLLGKQQRG